MLDTFMESVGRGEIKNSNMRLVTTKEVYKSRMSSLLTPPKVELKFPLVNFPELVYCRMNHTVLEMRQRVVSVTIIHGLYMNSDTEHKTHSVLIKPAKFLEQTVGPLFCSCFRVKIALLWLREKLIELLSDQGPAPALSNTELLMLMYTRCRREVEAALILALTWSWWTKRWWESRRS